MTSVANFLELLRGDKVIDNAVNLELRLTDEWNKAKEDVRNHNKEDNCFVMDVIFTLVIPSKNISYVASIYANTIEVVGNKVIIHRFHNDEEIIVDDANDFVVYRKDKYYEID